VPIPCLLEGTLTHGCGAIERLLCLNINRSDGLQADPSKGGRAARSNGIDVSAESNERGRDFSQAIYSKDICSVRGLAPFFAWKILSGPLLVIPAVILLLTAPSSTLCAQREPVPIDAESEEVASQEPSRWHFFAEEFELAAILDACSDAFDLPLEYDREKVRGRVTLRSGPGLTSESLWATANRILATRGLTSVLAPGEETIGIVTLEAAPKIARIEEGQLDEVRAGYVKVIRPLAGGEDRSVEEVLRNVLSAEGSEVKILGDSGQILLAGLKPQVEEAIRILELLHAPFSPAILEEVRPEHLSPTALVVLLERVTAAMSKEEPGAPRGTPLANPSSNTVLVVAPQDDLWLWRDLISILDHEEPILTRHYVPRRFELAETAKLIEEVVPKEAAAGHWRMVEDGLTGSLIISATPSQHARIEDVIERLESTELDSRRTLRTFPIRNRDVDEMLSLLEGLLGGDDLPVLTESEATDLSPPAEATGGRSITPDESGLDVTLTMDEGTNRILAIGPSRTLDELGRLIESLDVQHPQVLVEALVVTLTESQARDLVVSLFAQGDVGQFVGRVSTLFATGLPNASGGALPSPSGTGMEGVILDPGSFSGLLRALETVNEGRTLTVPKVLVNNNQTASLDSILQTPFTSTNASTTVATTSFGGTMDAGTMVSVTPQITDGDKLLLEYSVSLSAFVGDSADPTIPPPRQENRLQSVATIPDGYAVVVGGLEIESDTDAETRVPFLGRLPLLGFLFKSKSASSSRSRFFVFLRCTILRHAQFEDLRYLSQDDLGMAGIDDDWPTVEPRIIR